MIPLKNFKELPKYTFFKTTGTHHNPLFKNEVEITRSKKIIGQGSSKKNAQKNALINLMEC